MSNTKPTMPGWWWATLGREVEPDIVWADPDADPIAPRTWQTPIRSPAVCEALARYAEAYLNGFPLVQAGAETSLLSAIRAEVDGAA